VPFLAGSKPYMLRVIPDGKEVWVLTVGAQTAVVLDAGTMEVLHTEATGKGPVQCAIAPGGRYGLVTHGNDTFVLVVDAESGRTVTRIDVGAPQANVSFTPDGATAFVSVVGGDEVVAIDMAQLAVIGRIPTGGEPMGLILIDPTAP
jgi:YVTN family beta-propeller protein